MKIGVASNWGVGNFLFGMSLALSDICKNKRKNELFLLEAKKCGFDHKRNKKREISDELFSIFEPQIDLKVIYDESILKNGMIYRGFNFKHNLTHCQTYIQNVLKFSSRANQMCEQFLSSIDFKNSNSKDFISINIRGGDFKNYYNNNDERLDISYYDNIIQRLPDRLPIVVSVVPQEDTNEYKNKFKKYSHRIYFTNDYMQYPLCMPVTAKSAYCCISNSTFHWWGGFLNKNGKIYYPDPWFKKFKQEMWFPSFWIPVLRNHSDINSEKVNKISINKVKKKILSFPTQIDNSKKIVEITKSEKILKLVNKVNNKRSIIMKINQDGIALIDEQPEMICRNSGKDRIILFNKKTKHKVGELLQNSITKEYFVSLNIDGKTSATAWVGKEV